MFSTKRVLCFQPVALMAHCPGMLCISPRMPPPQKSPPWAPRTSLPCRSGLCSRLLLISIRSCHSIHALDEYMHAILCRHAQYRSLIQLSFFSLKGLLRSVIPREFLTLVSHDLLHRVYFIRVTFDELSIVIRETNKAHQLMFSLWRLPSQDCLYSIWIWSDAMLVYHPPEVIYRVLQYLTFRGLAFQPFSCMQALRPIARYHPRGLASQLPRRAHYKVTIFLVLLVSACDISCCNIAVALHSPNGILFYLINHSSQVNPILSLYCFLRGTCQKTDPRS